MENNLCIACRQSFQPRPQVPDQSYCSAPDCQRERRKQWHRQKLQTDPDYQNNQARAQKAWMRRNPNYWRKYRESHPEYVERNRVLQRERNAKVARQSIAKMDVSIPSTLLPSGIYHLSLVTDVEIAKMDVWTVEITVLAGQCLSGVEIAKR
ncbi:MAG: hypothetical protein ABFS45_10330 [Pseudomonadota bacterium]